MLNAFSNIVKQPKGNIFLLVMFYWHGENYQSWKKIDSRW